MRESFLPSAKRVSTLNNISLLMQMIKTNSRMRSARDKTGLQLADFSFAKLLIVFLVFQILSFQLFAQNFPAQPNPPRLVNDFANILSPAEREALEQKLVAYDDSTSTQIAIVTIETLEG